MPNVYAQMTKITNVVGRSQYITDQRKQEEIVLHRSRMEYDWSFYSKYESEHQKSEQKNIEAREIIIALPNDLYGKEALMELVCDDLAHALLGEHLQNKVRHDYEYAVHWNHDRTNLHMHLLFSERGVTRGMEPLRYKKDIWMDKDTHKLAKAGAENAELVHSKGDIQRDKEGNIKYPSDRITEKDKWFHSRAYVQEKNALIQNVMLTYGYELDLQDRSTPYLSQKKIGHGNPDYVAHVNAYNEQVRLYNDNVKEHIELDPNRENYYCKVRSNVEAQMADYNREEKKITLAAIDVVHDMTEKVREFIEDFKRGYERVADFLEFIKTYGKEFENRLKEKQELEEENRKIDVVSEQLDLNIQQYDEMIEKEKIQQEKEQEHRRSVLKRLENLKRESQDTPERSQSHDTGIEL